MSLAHHFWEHCVQCRCMYFRYCPALLTGQAVCQRPVDSHATMSRGQRIRSSEHSTTATSNNFVSQTAAVICTCTSPSSSAAAAAASLVLESRSPPSQRQTTRRTSSLTSFFVEDISGQTSVCVVVITSRGRRQITTAKGRMQVIRARCS